MELKPKGITISLIFLLSSFVGFSQSDTVINVNRHGNDLKLRYKIYKSRSSMNSLRIPIYVAPKETITKTDAALREFVRLEAKQDSAINALQIQNDQHVVKGAELQGLINKENLRAQNFKSAYDSLLISYNKLDTTFNDLKVLAKKERSKSWWRGVRDAGIVCGALAVIIIATK